MNFMGVRGLGGMQTEDGATPPPARASPPPFAAPCFARARRLPRKVLVDRAGVLLGARLVDPRRLEHLPAEHVDALVEERAVEHAVVAALLVRHPRAPEGTVERRRADGRPWQHRSNVSVISGIYTETFD